MKKSRLSEAQITSILKEGESGLPVDDLCRKHGIGHSTYYKWRWKLYHMLRNQGAYQINHKRVYRLYKELNLTMRRKQKRRLNVTPEPIVIPQKHHECWSIDFMSDSLKTGRRFRTFNVLDDYNREGLAIEIDVSLTAERIVRVLDRLAERRGYPQYLRCDNGPELRSTKLQEWCNEHHIKVRFIEPGKPTQNALIERFNGTYRRELLNAYVFNTLDEVRHLTEQWLDEHNGVRPHAGIGNVPPRLFQRENSMG